MLIAAKEKYNLNIKKSFFIGDRWRDVDAGNAAGCKTIFIDRTYNEKLNKKPNFIVKNLKKRFKYNMSKILNNLKVKIFADGASKKDILELNSKDFIKGFTTNPSLMKKSGITDYERFSKEILQIVNKKPFSLEVFADDFEEIEKQARKISQWGENVYVKIPISNSKGEKSIRLIKKLSNEGVKLNITAIFTIKQIEETIDALNNNVNSIISIFAGRIADTGVIQCLT